VSKTSSPKPTLNKADIDLLMLVLPTKAEVSQQLEELEKRQLAKYDAVITLLDDVISELKTVREEQIITAHQSKQHTDQMESTEHRLVNQEKRISKLELAANFA
jgi:hypothetical protein